METSPFLDLPGAVGDERYAVPAHYGSPLVEQRRLEAGAVVDLSHRGVVAVTGPDRLSWLDTMLSQDLRGLAGGASAESLLLDPSGRVQQALRVVDDGETTWMIVDAEHASELAAWLDGMRFMLQVEVADRSGDLAVLGWATPGSARDDVPAAVVWVDPWTDIAVGGVQYAGEDGHPASGWTWAEAIVDEPARRIVADRVRSGEIVAAGLLAADALRIAAWRPQLPDEGDDVLLPHEVDWLRTAVHLDKGCYRGQETVAKVHNLGHPPRRLVFLHLDGSESVLPSRGDAVLDEQGGQVGSVTSSAVHHELGPIALALVRRTASADSGLVVVSGGTRVAAAQEIIVPASAGSAVDVPRLPRLGRRTR